ncbi:MULTISPECIES: choice-of-anchor I family protein [unclassified Vibrio]|uniref:Choice-of-anchor I family protein n=1 Tax=Vibrio sp. HB236076 TaxID=3232307 RepID=A0AB39HG63_9VIBR|nr:choice-of-anchor I family protein [Vibrio sp. HB161653]MDP5253194.1 choice-of-anchor I family protein [Vibrio sp. HB161653]
MSRITTLVLTTCSVACTAAFSGFSQAQSLSVDLIGRYVADAPFATSAAEIVTYDKNNDQLFVVNAHAQRIEVLKPSATGLEKLRYLDLHQAGEWANIDIGAANSVDSYGNLLAVAIENKIKTKPGIIAVYDSRDLSLLTTFPAGSLPDMVGFSKDGRFLASANEGEPSGDYQDDPEGSVTLVDLSPGLEQAKAQQIRFDAFNQTRRAELKGTVRISGKHASAAQDLEPEYLTFASNGKLYVSLQENNALAIIDPVKAEVEAIQGLGMKSWHNAKLDASNKDADPDTKQSGLANFHSYEGLFGLYMPDTIKSYTVNGKSYIVTANEGDGREYGFKTTQEQCEQLGLNWDGDDHQGTSAYKTTLDTCISHSDEVRGKKLDVASDHPLANALKDNQQLARLKFIKPDHPLQANEPALTFGARSFSIWDDKGHLVFDSQDQFANIVAEQSPNTFNSTNDNNQSADDRSDDKGSEPEALEVAMIQGRQYAFIGLERQGGFMVYDVTDPSQASFVLYHQERDFSQPVCTQVDADGECENQEYNPKAGDLGPESIHYFMRGNQHYIAIGNEVSGTTSLYHVSIQ